MKTDKVKAKLTTLLGITPQELSAAFILLLGLVIGAVYNGSLKSDSIKREDIAYDIYRSADSLAEANRSTFIGTDVRNEADSNLVAGDTIVQKESFFGAKPGKEKKPQEPVNLNSASKVQLCGLPGIGEKTAIAILDYRKLKRFNSVEELMKIKGIGIKKFDKIKAYIKVN